jgi:hypothetical protein
MPPGKSDRSFQEPLTEACFFMSEYCELFGRYLKIAVVLQSKCDEFPNDEQSM